VLLRGLYVSTMTGMPLQHGHLDVVRREAEGGDWSCAAARWAGCSRPSARR
jgi:hypothetical protein